jgi:hypothetical protein
MRAVAAVVWLSAPVLCVHRSDVMTEDQAAQCHIVRTVLLYSKGVAHIAITERSGDELHNTHALRS